MKLMDLFRGCKQCGQSAAFNPLGKDGLCQSCREANEREELRRATEVWQWRIDQAVQRGTQRRCRAPKFKGGGVLTYYYHRIKATALNRAAIEQMALNEDYSVELAVLDGEVVGMKYDGPVIRLDEKQEMCQDWLRRGDPIFCEIVNLTSGSERLMLGFYRDEESRLASKPYELCKLASCRSEERQMNIACLDDGERLYLEEDDRGRLCVNAFPFDELGVLPAKYTKYDRFDFDAIIYDHGDDTGDDVIIPYVRVYLK